MCMRQGLTRGPTHMEQMAPHSRDTSTEATGARHGSDHTNTRRPCRHIPGHMSIPTVTLQPHHSGHATSVRAQPQYD